MVLGIMGSIFGILGGLFAIMLQGVSSQLDTDGGNVEWIRRSSNYYLHYNSYFKLYY